MGRDLARRVGNRGRLLELMWARRAQEFYMREPVQARVMARSCCHRSDDEGDRHWARC